MIDLSPLRRLRQRRGRRPPARKPRWRTIGLALLAVSVAVFAIVAVHAFLTMPALSIDGIELLGVARLNSSDVTRITTLQHSRPTLLVSLDRLRSELERIPTVRHAAVERRLPDSLRIQIEERQPLARVEVGGLSLLVDRDGALFPCGQPQPGDDRLPLLINLATPSGERQLAEIDRAALRAVEALQQLAKSMPIDPLPVTSFDLRYPDRIVAQPGPDAPLLWLDRAHPETNLANFFFYRDRVADLAPHGPIDLRFPDRLTVLPPDSGAISR